MRASATIILGMALISAPLAAQTAAPAATSAAVSDRSPDNLKLDESRKPAEVLRFLGIKPGMTAMDLFGGNKYWAELMVPAVGPKGRVIVWEPTQFLDAD